MTQICWRCIISGVYLLRTHRASDRSVHGKKVGLCEKLPGKPWGYSHITSNFHFPCKTVWPVLSDRKKAPPPPKQVECSICYNSPEYAKQKTEYYQTWKLPAAFQTLHDWPFTWRCLRCSLPSCQEGNGRSPPPGLGHRASLCPPSHHPGWHPQSGEAGRRGPSPASPGWWWSGGPCRQRGHILSQGDCFPHPRKSTQTSRVFSALS